MHENSNATSSTDGTCGMQLDWRLSDEPVDENTKDAHKDPEFRKGVKCKIFLGCTSNMISSGIRETIRFLIEHKMVRGLIINEFVSCKEQGMHV